MNIWRLQTNTNNNITDKSVADYCIENNLICMGWSLKDSQLLDSKLSDNEIQDIQRERIKISSLEDYCNVLEKYSIFGGNVDPNIKRLFYDVKENDIVWVRNKGIYYIGRISENSQWQYMCNDTTLNMDCANQRTNIKWYMVGDESSVPGAIATCFIKGNTLQRCHKTFVKEYSQLLYNDLCGKQIYSVSLSNNAVCKENFFSLFSPSDAEDLLCLWLYYKKGYITIPSTNKRATELYECVLKNPINGQNVFPQVKAGKVNLNAKNYEHLNGEVWLFTTSGKVSNVSPKCTNIHIANPQELFDFVASGKGNNFLPESIIKWYNLLTKIVNN